MKIRELVKPWPPEWIRHCHPRTEPALDEILCNAELHEVLIDERYDIMVVMITWDSHIYTADFEWVRSFKALYEANSVKVLKAHKGKSWSEVGELEVEPTILVIG